MSGKKNLTRVGQSTAISLGQISAKAAATLSPHANYPILLFLVPMISSPFFEVIQQNDWNLFIQTK